MPVSVYMLSVLQREALDQGAAFESRRAGAWLVWDRASRRSARARPTSDDERARRKATAPAAGTDDALCFQLSLDPGQGQLMVGVKGGRHVLVGAPQDCEHHLTLEQRDGRWVLAASHGEVQVNRLPPLLQAPLESGAVLTLGAVQLSFVDAHGLLERLLTSRATPLPSRPPMTLPEVA